MSRITLIEISVIPIKNYNRWTRISENSNHMIFYISYTPLLQNLKMLSFHYEL
ncbi:hypothetical protein M153_196000272 [Pseudoloma neurophilia]|uniref:Uncharacterized protein n=1 Tax=Pseudoloma neurophilia TaxID=146866 RepID=A0A0R0LZA0_9MICR|nr:hypothetical protein M153_196000272 [Pseudoloma neurophilia]